MRNWKIGISVIIAALTLLVGAGTAFAITASNNNNAPVSRADSLTQNFKQYEPFGVVYNVDQDAVFYNGARVKLFVDFKKDKEPGTKYAFDLCYRDFEADSNLYLEAVEDSSGKVIGLRLLDSKIAGELMGDMTLADSGEPSDKTQVWTLDGDTELEAYGISASDRVKKESVPQSVKDWIKKCDSKQGAYISASKTTDGYITYMYYNAGGRYPWNITCDGETVGIDLLFDDTFCGAEGYTLISFTSPKEYEGVTVSLNGVSTKQQGKFTFTKEIQNQLNAICDTYYTAQNDPAFKAMQQDKALNILAQWAEAGTKIKDAQWNFDSFTYYQVLDHDWKPAAREGQKLYYCTFSDGVNQYGFAAFSYDASGPSLVKYSVAGTGGELFDLDAVIDELAPALLASDLDLATTKAERISWLDREHNRSDAILLFTDKSGVKYYYFFGDESYELHKA